MPSPSLWIKTSYLFSIGLTHIKPAAFPTPWRLWALIHCPLFRHWAALYEPCMNQPTLILVGLGSVLRLSIRHGVVLHERSCELFAPGSIEYDSDTFTFHSGYYFCASRLGQKLMLILIKGENTFSIYIYIIIYTYIYIYTHLSFPLSLSLSIYICE